MTGITINQQHYEILGNNYYRNTATKKILRGDQITSSGQIHLGSGNNLRGASIGNKSITICPTCSFKGWGKASKIALFLGSGILITGVATAATIALPLIASVFFIAIGILAIICALFKLKISKTFSES